MTRAVGTPSSAGDSGSAKSRNKAATGLRIERVWTKPGIHPYDEVTWERRDVVMTNWRDGSINFEQRGVEFPDAWSVNATNIVTTKYFRGAVGTPQRETSLRQLIDRVVRTYRRAGEEYGYFNIGNGIPAGKTVTLVWDSSTNGEDCHQYFKAVFANGEESEPQQFDFCEEDVALEFE